MTIASDMAPPIQVAADGAVFSGLSPEVTEDERHTLLKRIQHALHGSPTVIPFVVLLLAIGLFSTIAGHRFLHPFNLSLVLQQVTIIAILGIGQTLIILTGGIDLSVAAIMVLSSVVMGRLAVLAGLPVELAFALGLLTGLACGLLNGMLVTKLRLPPFIVTLGTWSIFGALNLAYSRSETIRAQDVETAAPFLQFLGEAVRFEGARVTYSSVLMLLMVALTWYVLSRTAFGRHLHAVGDDMNAARLAGIDTDRVRIAAYALAGVICSIAGWALIGRIGAISSLSGNNANLDSITAVVIGGTSLFGGRGSIVGTLMGALIVGVFRNGLALAGADAVWQEFTIGTLIIVAVALDQWLRKVSA